VQGVSQPVRALVEACVRGNLPAVNDRRVIGKSPGRLREGVTDVHDGSSTEVAILSNASRIRFGMGTDCMVFRSTKT